MLKHFALASALLMTPVFALASNLPDYPFIHMKGAADQFVIPDAGQIDFELVAYDPDPAVARAFVERRLAEVLAALAPLGVAVDDVGARDIRKQVRRVDGQIPKGEPAYDLKCAVRLSVSDMTKWRDIMLLLIDQPNIDGLETGMRSTSREKIEKELIADALKEARRKAEVVAAGLGKHVGEATAVSIGDLQNVGDAIGLTGAESRRLSTAPRGKARMLEIPPMRMVQSVDVIFRIVK